MAFKAGDLFKDLFDKDYPAVYMSTLQLDPDTQNWLKGQQNEV